MIAVLTTPSSSRRATIQSPEDQQHPVSGNREFGVKTKDNKLMFYTQGADRLTGVVDLVKNYYDPLAKSENIFLGGDRLWQRVLDNVNNYINTNGGKSKTKYKYNRRFKYK